MKSIIHVLDKDKRKRKRVELFSNIQAQLEILGASSAVTIKDVSYSGFGLIVPPNTNMSAIESLEAKLSILNQDFKGTVANKIVLPNQEIKIGFSLPIQIQREIDFNTQDPSWDRVTDAEIVENIYQDLVIKGPEAPIEIKQQFSRAMLHPIELRDSGNMICEIVQIRQGTFEKGKAKCMFDLFQTCHAFDTNIDQINGNKIELKLSNVLARLLRRETVRVLKQNANYEISVLLRSESIGKEISEFEIYDYSEHGLSLKDPNGSLSLPRNLYFEEVIIEIKGIGTIAGKGRIRSYEWNRNQNSYIIGLLFEPGEEPNLTNWHNFILKARYPSLDFDYHHKDHAKIWDLFDRSDYMNLKESSGYTDILDLTKNTWIKLKDIGTGFSKRAMIRKDDKILGHIQMDQFYPNTWCVHHLAIDPTMSKLIAGELYALTTDVLLSEKGKYLINFTETTKSWNQRSYYNFIKNYRFPEHNELKEFYIYEAQIGGVKNVEINSKLTIRPSNKFDVKKIVKFFSDHLSALEIQACSLTEEDIELEKFNNFFKKFDLSRKRNLLACFMDDKLVGIARMEFGSEGVNVVGIQDMIYLYSVESENIDKNIIIDSLLKKALEVYASEGKNKVIITLNSDRIDDFKKYNIDFICIASRWIALKDILPRYHAFSQLLYGDINLRREKIRKKNKGQIE